jgi:hypothetical protein
MVHSFTPPAPENEVTFISILFIIEHFFLMIFLCLRTILSQQKCEADILIERRQIKRSIKKYFKESNILANCTQMSVVFDVIAKNKQK